MQVDVSPAQAKVENYLQAEVHARQLENISALVFVHSVSPPTMFKYDGLHKALALWDGSLRIFIQLVYGECAHDIFRRSMQIA